MKNLEPRVYRQRLVIEGHYKIEANGETIREYLDKLSKVLKMRIFSGPFSWPPDKWDHPEVELHELNGFVAWTESGCHVYAWRFCKFFTVDIYSCKKFNVKEVIEFTKDFFKSNDLVYEEIK
ncbi:MAG: S-adenosylmethionine decarboxylase [Candidatus Woesearchaeota archaeon]|nr:MAG: S-adenosylmethionine decarboxylase [Candidatus Woesearchaeota archaeon]